VPGVASRAAASDDTVLVHEPSANSTPATASTRAACRHRTRVPESMAEG
jgi:hypothetical protein